MKAQHLHHRIKLNQEFQRDVDCGCTICLHGMGSAFCMSLTGLPVQTVSSSLMPVTWALAATSRDTGVSMSSQRPASSTGS